MLIGRYQAKISPKGRLALPKKFREVLGDKIVVTVGYERSLMVVSAAAWHSLVEVTKDKPFIINSARDTNRFLWGGAAVVDLDDQGRFVLPPYLREHAAIKSEVVFLGLNRYVEIWDEQGWKGYQKSLHANIEKIAENLGQLNVPK